MAGVKKDKQRSEEELELATPYTAVLPGGVSIREERFGV